MRSDPTGQVLLAGNRLEMVGIHTGPVPAQMIEIEAFWNGTDVHLVGEPMGLTATSTVLTTASGPEPAITAMLQ
jgi:hypothetical protein